MSFRIAFCFACCVMLGSVAGCSNPSVPADTGSNPDVQQEQDATTADAPLDVGGTDVAPVETGADATPDSPAVDATDTGTAMAGGHLLITEVSVGTEFVEITNLGTAAVDLTNYYLSDNSTYHSIASGMPWNPTTMNPGTDFLARFPAGAMIPAGGVIVVAMDAMFQTTFRRCPDFVLLAGMLACEGGMARAMVAPTNGDLGNQAGGMLSNAREMVVLFRWSGNTADRLFDVDYVTWGDMFDDGTRADKTGIARYVPDTARAMQRGAPVPGVTDSIERCAIETGERLTGGNGITGHDETSERLDMSFRVQTMPTPGTRNACL